MSDELLFWALLAIPALTAPLVAMIGNRRYVHVVGLSCVIALAIAAVVYGNAPMVSGLASIMLVIAILGWLAGVAISLRRELI